MELRMKPEARLAQWLMASAFLVMGGYRLWQATHGAPIANGTLVMSAVEALLGLLLVSGWRLRMVALLAAAMLVGDAIMLHRFWKFSGTEQAIQLLHFMKDVGFIGGLLLLSSLTTGGRRR
jgi:putative oxidoreductase